MFFCENCRVKNKWPKSLGWPFMGVSYGRCEICRKHTECHDVPSSALKNDTEKTTEEKTLDKAMQQEYKQKAESLVVTFVDGPASGRIDHRHTQELREIFIRKNGTVDWFSTYHLRVRAQEMYHRTEQIKRDKQLNSN
jgi:hypothetical protein